MPRPSVDPFRGPPDAPRPSPAVATAPIPEHPPVAERAASEPDAARRRRTFWLDALVAVALGAAVARASYLAALSTPDFVARDLTGPLRLVHDLLAGVEPYIAHQHEVPRYPSWGPTIYPVTVAIPLLPLARLSPQAALGVFTGCSSGVLLFACLRRAPHRLAALLSSAFYRALALGQWSPLFVAAAALPPVGILAACKPNLGLALFAYRPTRWIVFGGLALCLLGLILVPAWPYEWLHHASGSSFYVAPVTLWRAGGPLLLLAALRWRTPEGRLLLALSCVPHNLLFYDQLLLFLVARTRVEAWLLAALSWAAMYFADANIPPGVEEPAAQVYFRVPILLLLYLPALVMVLRQPADRADYGDLPWFWARLRRVPARTL